MIKIIRMWTQLPASPDIEPKNKKAPETYYLSRFGRLFSCCGDAYKKIYWLGKIMRISLDIRYLCFSQHLLRFIKSNCIFNANVRTKRKEVAVATPHVTSNLGIKKL